MPSWLSGNAIVTIAAASIIISPARLAASPKQLLIQGLDHMPLAVRNLDEAAANFSRLGFAIKPGRLHNDGIRNKHVKFPNGGGIELITASNPTDALAQEYTDFLAHGDGPAFWSLYSPDLAALTTFLAQRHLDPTNTGDVVTFSQAVAPHRLFFADRLRSPTDGPAYWSHPNTAYQLQAIWLAGASAERQLLVSLGAKSDARAACAPFDTHAQAYVLPGESNEVILSPALNRTPERSIVAATVRVRSLAVAQHTLTENHVHFAAAASCTGQSIWISPESANNLWLELTE